MREQRRIQVLVVDDEPSICDSLVHYLEDYGFEVTAAASAEEALELLAHKPQDVAIIDIRLPGMDGSELVLEASKIQPALRFLVYTGSSNYCLSGELQRIGVSSEDIFLKPVRNLDLVREAIVRLLKRGESSGDE